MIWRTTICHMGKEFSEDDEDPARIFALFDAAPKGRTTPTPEQELADLERRETRPCPGCGHLPAAHESGRPASTLMCRDCPEGICYTLLPDGREAGPGALPTKYGPPLP